MNEDVNSILYNKKTQKSKLAKISEENSKKPNYVIIFLVIAFIALSIYYIVYYNTILTGKNILLNNLNIIYKKYSIVYDSFDLDINKLNGNYNFEGILTINNNNDKKELNYIVNNIDKKFQLTLKNNEESFIYYADKNNNYTNYNKVSDKFIPSTNATINDYINVYNTLYKNIDSYLTNKKDYKKTIYFKNENPQVRIDMQLDNNDINNIINNNKIKIKDNYKVNITLINNALTNEIIETKLVINNITKKRREVFTYKDGNLFHTNNKGLNNKYEISKEDKDFTIKVYKNNILYSVLSGRKDNNSYKYLYQIIDKKYTINLTRTNNKNNNYDYRLNINIDDNTKKDISININGNYNDSPKREKLTINTTSKKELSKDKLEIYNNILDNILGFKVKEVFD